MKRFHLAAACGAIAALSLMSCARGPASDGEQIVAAVARTLASRPGSVCVDRRTSGEALEVWRDARQVVSATAGTLGWSRPAPLTPPDKVEYVVETAGRRQERMIEPIATARPLPRPLVQQVQSAALHLTWSDGGTEVMSVAGGPGVSSRPWLLNRIWPRCAYAYQLSNPARFGDIGFVAVTANHWGTVYAVQHGPAGWRTIAQWTPWLY